MNGIGVFRNRGLLAVALAGSLTASLLVPGRSVAFDAQAFSPAVGPQEYFSLHSSKTAPQNRFYVGLWYSFSDETMVFEPDEFEDIPPGVLGAVTGPLAAALNEATDPLDPALEPLLCALKPALDPLTAPLVDELVDCPTDGDGRSLGFADEVHTGYFVASYSLLDWAEVGVTVPVSTINSDIPGVEEGIGIDDVRLNGKFQLIDAGEGGLGFAIVPFVEFPTGDEDRLTANDGWHWGGVGVLEAVGSKMRGALNLGYRVNDEPISNDDEPDQILFGAGLGFLIAGAQPILGADEDRLELLGEIFGSTSEQDPFENDLLTPVEFLVGARYYHNKGLIGTVGAGRRITDGINSPDIRIVANLGYTWQPKPPPPPPPPPAPEPMEKVVVTDEEIVTLEPIYFDFDKSTIKSVSYPVLDEIVMIMNDRPGIGVRVEGHTDAIGTDQYNVGLAERRTASVVSYLIEKGISPDRLEAAGFGENRPIATNETSEGRALNRRTEFKIQNVPENVKIETKEIGSTAGENIGDPMGN